MSTFCRRSCEFQSTLPHGSDRERTQRHAAHGISIHAPSRERQGLLQLLAIGAGISIHAPSRERPLGALTVGKIKSVISIHAPSRERRTKHRDKIDYLLFQSTLPHGSDQLFSLNRLVLAYFTPRSLAGATLPSVSFVLADLISIHASLRERLIRAASESNFVKFQSTLPCGSDHR